MSRSVDYWKERAKKEEALSRKRDRDVSKELDDLYKLYIKEIEKQIYSMEKRFSEKKGLTIAELKKLTDQYDVQAFNAKAAKYVKERNFTDKANRELSWYNFAMRLNRLEAIKAELSLEMLALAGEEIKTTGNFLDAEYLYRLKSQANILGISIPTDLTLRSKTRAIVDSNFEGAVWSERIWGRQEKLRDLVVKTVSDLLILGKNPTTSIPEIRRAFDVSVFEAKRLAVTEGARVAMAAQKNIIKANGFEYYIYLPETSACKICKPLDEKIFRIDDMQSGKNAPPMHPFCKCTIASYYVDEKIKRVVHNSFESMGVEYRRPRNSFDYGSDKVYNQAMKSSGAVYGAWNAKNDPDEIKRKAHAEQYYESVRNRDTSNEVRRIANNTGFSERDVRQVYNHVFENHYDLEGGRRRFDPDYDMAQSWERLFSGKNIQTHDFTLLRHELLESKLMAEGLDYETAHKKTQREYDYLADLIKWQIERGDL